MLFLRCLLCVAAATSLEELLLAPQELDTWRSLFEAAGRGEHLDATALSEAQPLRQLDADFGLRLREEPLRERLRSLKERPEELLRLVNEPLGEFKVILKEM